MEVHISSRVTNRFFGECDFDLTVREKGGNKHVFPAILINPGGESAITIYRLRPEEKQRRQLDIHQWHAKLPVQHGYHADEVPERSRLQLSPTHPEDLDVQDMDLRLETVGLYQGLSCIRGAEHTDTTRAYVLKILKDTQP